MPAFAAAAVVFVAAAAVLVLEILAGRLLAPYVGVTLETYTAIIGIVLAGIAVGASLGGFVADRIDPRRLLGPILVAGGALSISSVPVVRALGDATTEHVNAASVLLAFAAFFLPAVVLSTVTPTVAKLQLRDLGRTGSVVGRLSGIGTFGALVGTFVTGFILVAEMPTRTVVYGVGAFLTLLGTALWLWQSRRGRVVMAALLAATASAAGFAAAADDVCEVESAYACLNVRRGFVSPGGRVLWINREQHSYYDLHDPTHLEWGYTQAFGDVADVAWPRPVRLDALHIGGGGFTMPRYLEAVRPGSTSIVLELDPGVVKVGREHLDLRTSPRLQVREGDARVGIRSVRSNSIDFAVGDAFSDLTVPWHLTTREFVRAIDRTLRPDGVYVMNVIDEAPFRFLRAEIATLRERFEWVAAISPSSTFTGGFADNVVLVASHRVLDRPALTELVGRHGQVMLSGARLARFTGDADVLTDDYAPVDQWLSNAD